VLRKQSEPIAFHVLGGQLSCLLGWYFLFPSLAWGFSHSASGGIDYIEDRIFKKINEEVTVLG
jgi:hypothetical protein